MNSGVFDYIIIGGGISGVYALHLFNEYIKSTSKIVKVLLIEKNKNLGGRSEEVMFHNNLIKLGAGIGEDSNTILLNLLDKLKLKYNKSTGDKNVIDNDELYSHNKTLQKIKKTVAELKHKNVQYNHLTLKQFIKLYLTPFEYKNYLLNCEYCDYLNGDVDYYIKYYPIEDDKNGKYSAIFLSWNLLIKKLLQNSKRNQIKLNTTCKSIIKLDNNIYKINTNKGIHYSHNVITCLTIDTFSSVTSKLNIIDYSKYIGSVPFVRIYTYHKNGHNFNGDNVDHFNILANNNPLQKIIVMNDKILMASYSNSQKALFWKNIKSKSNLKNIVDKKLKQIVPTTSKIDDIYIKYWNEGIHYFKPLKKSTIKELIKKLENPTDNFYVCGEMVSYRQGWVEGSLESIKRVVSDIIIHKLKMS